MPILGMQEPTAYRILISRNGERPRADLYGISLAQPLPPLPLPLKPNEPQPLIDLQTVLTGVYARGRYGRRIDYG
jgi:hypothetical protein